MSSQHAWFRHQERLDGSAIGAIRFGSDTAEYFRKLLLRPFFDHFLKDDAPPLKMAPVTAFEKSRCLICCGRFTSAARKAR
jgi:hypothetical protein